MSPVNVNPDAIALVIDGGNIFHRNMHALELTTKSGKNVSGVYGVLAGIHGLLNRFRADHVFFCWDEGRSAWRKKLYPEYKATRKKLTDDQIINFTWQKKHLKKMLKMLGVRQLSIPHTEADDLIAMLVSLLNGGGIRNIIVSTDLDFVQLLSGLTSMFSPIKKKTYRASNIKKLLDFETPQQYFHYRLLTGDTSDNIKGVPGIGDVWGRRLIKRFKDIRRMLQKKKQGKMPDNIWKRVQMVKSHAKIIVRNTKLMALNPEFAVFEELDDEQEDVLRAICKEKMLDEVVRVRPKRLAELAKGLQFNSMMDQRAEEFCRLFQDCISARLDGEDSTKEG